MYEDIISFVNQNDGEPFFVAMCGISYCDGTYHITRRSSNISVMEYIVSGIGTVTEDNRTFEAGEGDVYFLKEGSLHDYYSDSENPWVKIWFNFSGELSRQITRCYGLENHPHFHAPELKARFEEIYRISRSKKSASCISDDIAKCFLGIAQALSYKIMEKKTGGSMISMQLKEYIDNMTDFGAGLEQIIKPFFCSKSHAIREFKNSFAVTPYEYIQRKRFFVASELLRNTALPVSDIAERLGFYDVQYFSGSFKKRTGVTPTEFRKNKR